MKARQLISSLSLGLIGLLGMSPRAIALPPPEDIPEEVLQMEIITEAVSPLNGEPLTAAEFAELEAQLTQGRYAPPVSEELQQLIFLLRLRRLINTFSPIPLL